MDYVRERARFGTKSERKKAFIKYCFGQCKNGTSFVYI